MLLSIDAVMGGQILGVEVGAGMSDGVGDRGAGVGDRGAGVGDRGEGRDRCVAVDGRGVRVHGGVQLIVAPCYEHLADVACEDGVSDAGSGCVWWALHSDLR